MNDQFNIADLLPMPPWLGPPLPQGIGIYWPWLQGKGGAGLPMPELPSSLSPGTYQNEETWDIEWEEQETEDEVIYLPKSIRIHRHANRS